MEFPLCVNLKSIFNNVFFASHIQLQPFPDCFLALLTLRLKNLSSLIFLVFKSYLLLTKGFTQLLLTLNFSVTIKVSLGSYKCYLQTNIISLPCVNGNTSSFYTILVSSILWLFLLTALLYRPGRPQKPNFLTSLD